MVMVLTQLLLRIKKKTKMRKKVIPIIRKKKKTRLQDTQDFLRTT